MFSLTLLLALSQAIHSFAVTGANNKPGINKAATTIQKSKPKFSRGGKSLNQKHMIRAEKFVEAEFGFGSNEYIVKNAYTSDDTKVSHIYLRQIKDGKEIVNADININVSKSGEILSYGNTFTKKVSTLKKKSPGKKLGAIQAVEVLVKDLKLKKSGEIKEVKSKSSNEILLQNVPGALHEVRATEAYFKLEDGSLEPVWDFELELEVDYFHAQVSVNSKKVVNKVNWTSRFAYRVIPFGINDPIEGKRKIILDPHDDFASPLGWHDFGNGEKTINTAGNNVFAVKLTEKVNDALDPSIRAESTNTLFSSEMNETKEPSTYWKASVTNIFYYTNMMHDLFYRFGFDEKSGNFQENNFGDEGKENDPVIASAQDKSSTNNAFFKAGPDGQKGVLRLGLFDDYNPQRDSGFDSGIMIHELSHGLSTRLTGGPNNADCLAKGEAAGLGEGWSDIIPTMIRMNSKTKKTDEFTIGKYIKTGKGRNYAYSTSHNSNPSDFELVGKTVETKVHDVGEIWAVILFEVYWSLVESNLPIADDWFKAASDPSKYANTLLLKLIIEGMRFQPCYPTFLQARDAIILAEKEYTNEKNKCALWKGFAKRGMGIDAKGELKDGNKIYKNGFGIPKDCK